MEQNTCRNLYILYTGLKLLGSNSLLSLPLSLSLLSFLSSCLPAYLSTCLPVFLLIKAALTYFSLSWLRNSNSAIENSRLALSYKVKRLQAYEPGTDNGETLALQHENAYDTRSSPARHS